MDVTIDYRRCVRLWRLYIHSTGRLGLCGVRGLRETLRRTHRIGRACRFFGGSRCLTPESYRFTGVRGVLSRGFLKAMSVPSWFRDGDHQVGQVSVGALDS